MLSTSLQTGAVMIALALGVVSFIASYGCFHFCMRVAKRERDYRALLLWMQEIDDNHEALAASHKRLRSRVGMRELREKRRQGENAANDDDASAPAVTSVDEWKRRMRVKLHKGEIKP